MPATNAFTIIAERFSDGQRLDVYLAAQFEKLTRSRACQLLLDRNITVNGEYKKPSYRVRSGDRLEGEIPPAPTIDLEPEALNLDILYEDHSLVVINKPPGIVVHPSPGHNTGTLVSGLLHHCPEIGPVGEKLRPGIVHRLDKDTSGVMVVAKDAAVHSHLGVQFASRSIRKVYLALVYGLFQSDTGCIELPIGRHPVDRKRMSICSHNGRTARTQWRVRERFEDITLLELLLKTGRTHQARVHCEAFNHGIVGDPVYGSRRAAAQLTAAIAARVEKTHRQMLHAWQLEFTHPNTAKRMQFEAPIPQDMNDLIATLRDSAASNN